MCKPVVSSAVFTLAGHEALRLLSGSLAAILAAGQWKSSAFMRYLDESNLEKEVAFETAIDSEPDEWID